MYKAGERMIYTDGVTYRAKMDTAYSPEEYAQAWEAAEVNQRMLNLQPLAEKKEMR